MKQRLKTEDIELLRRTMLIGVVFLAGWVFWSFVYAPLESFADYQTTGRVYPESDIVVPPPPERLNGCTGGSCGSGHWAVLDEISYDFTDYIFDDNGGNNEVEEFEMTSIAGPSKTVNEVRVNLRARVANASGSCAAACDQLFVSIFIDGLPRVAQVVVLPLTDQQHTLVWPGPYIGDDDLRVRIQRVTQGAADDIRISRLYTDIDFTQPNAPPQVDNVTTIPSPADVQQGESINFEIGWSDPNAGDSVRAIVCKTNAVVGGSTPGCPGDAWTEPSPVSATSPISLNYKTTSNDVGTNQYYVFVCDSPGGECSPAPPLLPLSSPASGTFDVEAITASLYGWAWSSNIGWISFDSNDCDGDPVEGDGITDAVNNPNCPVGLPTSAYGVGLYTPTGDISDFAWNSNVGWITFNRAQAGNPPAPPFNGGSGPIARLEGPNLRGWARACGIPPGDTVIKCGGGGWDGWIRFDEDLSGGASPYSPVTFDGNTEEFEGWAWGSDVVGWMSMNCNNPEDDGSGGDCATVPHTVRATPFNAAPSVTNLNVSFSPSAGPVCTSQMRFSWDFGDPEDGDLCADPSSLCGYRLQVSILPDTWVPSGAGGVLQFDSGVVRSGAEERFVTIAAPATHEFDDQVADGDGTLAFNSNYYWRMQVYDSDGQPSEWTIYQNNAAPAEPFTTSLYPYPQPNFDWDCYESDGTTLNPDCSVPNQTQFNDRSSGTGALSWNWALPLNPPAPPTPDPMPCMVAGCETTQNPRVIVDEAGLYTVRLTVTDGGLAADGNSGSGSCSIDKIVMGQYPLPDEFKEITPVSSLKVFMDRLFSVLRIEERGEDTTPVNINKFGFLNKIKLALTP